MPRPVPDAKFEDLIPPNADFPFFEGHGEHPFPTAGSSLATAWWLADASLLAYSQPDEAKMHFAAAGLETAFFDGPSTQCYAAASDEFVIVAFRGTEVLTRNQPRPLREALRGVIEDLCTDSKFCLDGWPLGGRVHRGFKDALEEVWDDLSAHLEYLDLDSRGGVWFTGHSLGGALATLAADRYRKARGLFTFGAPCVGDRHFAKRFDLPALRFVFNNDLVTRVPPRGPRWRLLGYGFGIRWYEHIGTLQYISRDGVITPGAPKEDLVLDRLEGHLDRILDALDGLTAGELLIPDDFLTDHAPVYYATHVRNAFESGA